MKYQALLGLGGIAAVNAHPARPMPNVHTKVAKRGVDISKYTMPDLGTYVTSEAAKDVDTLTYSSSDYVEAARQLVKQKFPDLEFRVVDDHYVGTNGIAHVNLKQTAHGIDIDNADFHVNVRDGKLFSHGNSFFTGSLPSESPLKKRSFAGPVDALKGAVDTLGLPVQVGDDTSADAYDSLSSGASEHYVFQGTGGTFSQPEARLVYLQKSGSEELKLTWRVETDVKDNWLLTYVDSSSTNEVLGVVDYISDATYQVYPWGVNDPSEGSRQVLEDPWLISASKFTWQSDGKNYTATRGNNGIAQTNPDGGDDYQNQYRPNSEDLSFVFPFSLNETDKNKYRDASITQLFYTANHYHDLLYVLGFTEKAGNFENNNNGQGGKGGDFVILNSQDGSGTNNAQFGTPPDGKNGRMSMFMWDETTPNRDGCFEAGIVIHEYTHGLSTRLTGGPANSNCLAGDESGGMGEGWGDFFATTIRLKPHDTREADYSMGAWAMGDVKGPGIRNYVYSTNMKTNPQTYKDVDAAENVHDKGEIWCVMLYEVLWNLIDKLGKNDDAFPSLDDKGVPDDGKFYTLKIVQDAMALQPCNPDFIAARDAILDADKALSNGDNKCEIWKGFAKRGMGPNAKNGGLLGLGGLLGAGKTEDFEVPEACK